LHFCLFLPNCHYDFLCKYSVLNATWIDFALNIIQYTILYTFELFNYFVFSFVCLILYLYVFVVVLNCSS
jgi:hypothetical protein